MALHPCKDCSKEIEGSFATIADRCSPCNKKKVELHRRIISFILIPVWLPLLTAALLIGMGWAVLCRGFRSGVICVKEMADAWSPEG